jgi:cell division protein FtsN
MNETPIPETDPEAEDALKRRLINRIAVATVVMLGLIGSLALFDAINAPDASPPVKVATAPAKIEAPKAIEPAKPESAPVAATDAPAAAPGTETPPGAPPKADAGNAPTTEAKAVPEATVAAAASPLPPLPAEKPLTPPATSRPASMRPAEPVPAAVSPAARPDAVRELTQAPAVARRPPAAPASRPVTQAAERHYALQMGVFGNLANAEDLRAKLELHGIPASIEARVHAGPFKNREEVELARAKIKELGLDGILISHKK